MKSHLFGFLGYKNVKALQRTLGYYHGKLMYFVKVNVVIHVYKTCTLLNSHTWRADQYELGCISLRYVLLQWDKGMHVTLAMVLHAN